MGSEWWAIKALGFAGLGLVLLLAVDGQRLGTPPTGPPPTSKPVTTPTSTPTLLLSGVATFGNPLVVLPPVAPIHGPTAGPTQGRTPAPAPDASSAPALDDLEVASIPEDLPAYSQRRWHHWIDADGDCQYARQEVLIEESVGLIIFADAKQCRVESGQWVAPFTGTEVTDPRKLANGHRSGGYAPER